MEEKKLFLDENVSLPQLAEMLNIHPNYLSQVINERFHKNFSKKTYPFADSKEEKNRKKLFFKFVHHGVFVKALSFD